MAPVSVLILTKNEEVNIERCLRSVAWSDDVVVFDSYSEDRTLELAESMGARTAQRKFDNYAAQRNAALALDYRYDWILMVDADECVSPELEKEMKKALSVCGEDVGLFQMRRQDYFFDRWIKRASAYPTWFGRLVRKGRIRVERQINEEYHTDGTVENLQEHLIHYPFAKGIGHWFERHNRYSSMEAAALIEEVAKEFSFSGLWSRNPVVRRKALKQLAYRLPGRPLMVFLYLSVVRGGFLDGRPGLLYCMMRSMYEFMIDIKVLELRFRQRHQNREIL